MSLPGQKSWKINDLIAHEANVNCLALGQKSGCVLVTGGDDNKVNLWAVQKNKCIMSLSGRCPIQCVRFDFTENHVAAGSFDGLVKVWDLEAAKLIKTLSGHTGPVRALEFHPYGDFLTSGSQDSLVKLWDIRRKGCIFTYKGHSIPINCVRFSPDGQWISSAGQDGIIKLWDLRAGKMLHEFNEHKASVNSLVFHPHEFLLASASVENTINFYDLEHFELVSSTSKDSPPPRCLHFSSDGGWLYAGSTDALRTYLWEPARTLVNMHIPWGRVHDMATNRSNSKLVGASLFQATVSVWMVDMVQVKSDLQHQELNDPPSSPFSSSNPLRKSFSKQKPSPEAKKTISVKTIEESERSETETEEDPLPHIPDVQDYSAVFRPNRTLNRSPPPPLSLAVDEDTVSGRLDSSQLEMRGYHNSGSGGSSLSPKNTGSPPSLPPPYHSRITAAPPAPPPRPPPSDLPPRRTSLTAAPSLGQLHLRSTMADTESSDPETDLPVMMSSIHHSQSETSIPQRAAASQSSSLVGTANRRQKNKRVATTNNVNKMAMRDGSLKTINKLAQSSSTHSRHNESGSHSVVGDGGRVSPHTARSPSSTTGARVTPRQQPSVVPMFTSRPANIDFSEFLPNSFSDRSDIMNNMMDENEVLESLINDHSPVMAIMDQRTKKLQILLNIWQTKGPKTCLDSAAKMRDNGVMADLLPIAIQKPDIWNLDVCVVILPSILDLFNTKYELYLKVACDTLRLILRNFTPVIRTNVMSGSAALGVDITREERYNKCMKCYNSLLEIRAFVLKLQTQPGPLGHSLRELHNSLQAIDQPS